MTKAGDERWKSGDQARNKGDVCRACCTIASALSVGAKLSGIAGIACIDCVAGIAGVFASRTTGAGALAGISTAVVEESLLSGLG